jgi:hypothetical protein
LEFGKTTINNSIMKATKNAKKTLKPEKGSIFYSFNNNYLLLGQQNGML